MGAMKQIQQFSFLLFGVMVVLIGCRETVTPAAVNPTATTIVTETAAVPITLPATEMRPPIVAVTELPTITPSPTIKPTATPDWQDDDLFSISERRIANSDGDMEAIITFSQPTSEDAGGNNYNRVDVVDMQTGASQLVGERWERAALGGTQFSVRAWSADKQTLYFEQTGVGDGCGVASGGGQLQQFEMATGDVSAAPYVGLPNAAETYFATLDNDKLLLTETATGDEQRIPFDVPSGDWLAGKLAWLDEDTVTFTVYEDDPCPFPVFADVEVDAPSGRLSIVPTATPIPSPTPTATPSPTPEPLGYVSSPCAFDTAEIVRDVSCGVLTVPENRSDPDNQNRVKLPVAIFASPSNDPQPDPIIFLDGGPGANTLAIAEYAFELQFGLLLQDRDLILFDQRGMGFAEPSLACPEFDAMMAADAEKVLTVRQARRTVLAVMEACHARLTAENIDLSAYNSVASAADVADLRLALGYDEWNLLGVSYGTRLAQTIMRDHPEGVRSVVLDSVQPIAADMLVTAETNTKRAFDLLYQRCAAVYSCSSRFTAGITADLAALAAQLDDEPLPVSVFFNEQFLEIPLTGDRLIGLIYEGLYSAELIPYLPRLITEVEDGDTALVSVLLASELISNQFASIGAHFSIQCREEHSFVDEDEIEQLEDAVFSGLFDTSLTLGPLALDVCDIWDVDPAPATENNAITSTIPTLILAGSFDPITPPAWGQQVAAGLSNSQFFQLGDAGHGVSATVCGRALLFAFYDTPTRALTGRCAGGRVPQFQFAQVLAPVEMVSADLFAFDLKTKLPFGWTEMLPGVYARQNSVADPTVLMQQATAGDDTDAFLNQLIGGLEIDLGEPTDTYSTTQAMWTQYQTPLGNTLVDVAVTTDGDNTIGVVLISDTAEREILYRQVMLPVLETVRLIDRD